MTEWDVVVAKRMNMGEIAWQRNRSQFTLEMASRLLNQDQSLFSCLVSILGIPITPWDLCKVQWWVKLCFLLFDKGLMQVCLIESMHATHFSYSLSTFMVLLLVDFDTTHCPTKAKIKSSYFVTSISFTTKNGWHIDLWKWKLLIWVIWKNEGLFVCVCAQKTNEVPPC